MAESRGLADVAAEAVLLAGGGRAILLQVAHPAVAAGVAAHSRFATDPSARLRGTLTYVYAAVYGTPAQRALVKERVDRAHAAVRGPGYDALDPELQLWVAATLYDSMVVAHDAVLGPLDEAAAERVYREFGVLGSTLQVPVSRWPSNRAAFAEYFADASAALRVGDDARAIARRLLRPEAAAPWLRAVMPTVRLVTAGLLPPELRRAYGLPWSAGRERRLRLIRGAARRVYPLLPRGVRFGPRDRLLRGLDGPPL